MWQFTEGAILRGGGNSPGGGAIHRGAIHRGGQFTGGGNSPGGAIHRGAILRVPSFQYKLTLYSQLCKILEKVETSTVNIQSVMKVVGEELMSLCQRTTDGNKKKIELICKQLIVHSSLEIIEVRNTIHTLSDDINFFLRSRNAYKALRSLLVLPCVKTIHSFFLVNLDRQAMKMNVYKQFLMFLLVWRNKKNFCLFRQTKYI